MKPARKRIATVTALHAARPRCAGRFLVDDLSPDVLEHIYAGECQVCESQSELEARLHLAVVA